MKEYWSILRVPLILWVLYLAFGFFINRYYSDHPLIIKGTDIAFLALSLLMALWVCFKSCKQNLSFWETYIAVVLFSFFCSAVTWAFFVLSERHTIHGISQGIAAILVVLLYASFFSAILGGLIVGILYPFRSIIHRATRSVPQINK